MSEVPIYVIIKTISISPLLLVCLFPTVLPFPLHFLDFLHESRSLTSLSPYLLCAPLFLFSYLNPLPYLLPSFSLTVSSSSYSPGLFNQTFLTLLTTSIPSGKKWWLKAIMAHFISLSLITCTYLLLFYLFKPIPLSLFLLFSSLFSSFTFSPLFALPSP